MSRSKCRIWPYSRYNENVYIGSNSQMWQEMCQKVQVLPQHKSYRTHINAVVKCEWYHEYGHRVWTQLLPDELIECNSVRVYS